MARPRIQRRLTLDPLARSVALLLFSPFLIIAVHMAIARILRGVPNQIGAVVAILTSLVPACALAWAAAFGSLSVPAPERFAAWAYFLLAYSCIGYSYFHVFNMSETARRIRILHEFYKAGTLTREQILPLYGAQSVIGVRLERLADTGQLKLEGGRYRLNGRLLYRAALFLQFWRALLGFVPFEQVTLNERK